MKPIKRKLTLNTQTLRNLSTDQLGRVMGGSEIISVRAQMCSSYEETGCYPTGNDNCQTGLCGSVGRPCPTNGTC